MSDLIPLIMAPAIGLSFFIILKLLLKRDPNDRDDFDPYEVVGT